MCGRTVTGHLHPGGRKRQFLIVSDGSSARSDAGSERATNGGFVKALTLIAVAVMALGVSVAPGASAIPAPSQTIRVEGTGTSFVDLTLPAVSVTAFRTLINTSGSYAGWWLVGRGAQPKGNKGIGAVRFPRYDFGGDHFPVAILGGTGDLAAGQYRLYLASDGSASVTIPVKGLATQSITLHPRRRTQSQGFLQEMTVQPLGVVRDSKSQFLRISSKDYVSVTTAYGVGTGATVEDISACLTSAQGDCSSTGYTATGYTESLFIEGDMSFTVNYPPGDHSTMAAKAVGSLTAGPRVKRAVVAVFAITTV